MMFIKYCFVFLFLASFVASQDVSADKEIEFADPEKQDKIFDDSLLNEKERPQEPPNEKEVQRLLDSEFPQDKLDAEAIKEGEVARAARSTELISVNLYYYYFKYSDWYINYYRCCPKSQYYGCGVTRAVRHPCFYHYNGGSIEWCCPFYPNVYIYNCNCGTCVQQCPETQCFATGKCYRRYRYQKMYAVCYRKGWWSYLRAIYRYVPSGCYCSAKCG